MDLLKYPCPFCGSEPVLAGKVCHCSSVACALNRVDVPEAQWATRPVEDGLIDDNDRLRDTVARQNRVVMDLGERLEAWQREKKERLAIWRKKKQDAEQRARGERFRGFHNDAMKRMAPY